MQEHRMPTPVGPAPDRDTARSAVHGPPGSVNASGPSARPVGPWYAAARRFAVGDPSYGAPTHP